MTNRTRLRASAFCLNEGNLLVVRLRDPSNGREYRLPPGGAIEPGETPAQAAVRETREETGYDVVLTSETPVEVRYLFSWAGREVPCLTYFFPARLASAARHAHEPEEVVVAVEWIPVETLEAELNYHPVLCEAVLRLARGAG